MTAMVKMNSAPTYIYPFPHKSTHTYIYNGLLPINLQGKGTTGKYTRSNTKEFISTRRQIGNKANHEIKILKELQDLPGIIPLVHIIKPNMKTMNTINILTPKMTSDLYHFIDNKIPVIPKNILLDIFKQIIETVISMHKKRICHLDLKLENIVIDDENKIYIIDFESAEKMDENGFFKEKIFGTQGYVPLDLIRYAKLNNNHTALINGCAMDMYAVCTIMIKSWIHQYGVKDKEMIELFEELRYKCIGAKPDLEFQEDLLETIEALLLIENNELQNSKNGGYKKPRRIIHKQYTRKRDTVPSYKKAYRF